MRQPPTSIGAGTRRAAPWSRRGDEDALAITIATVVRADNQALNAAAIEPRRRFAHIQLMSTTQTSKWKVRAPKAAKAGASFYRGVKLQKLAVRSRTPIAELRRAVKAAFEKNANAIARIG